MSGMTVPPKRAQEILGRADVRTAFAIYARTMKRMHENSAEKIAELQGLANFGGKLQTNASVESKESELSYWYYGFCGCWRCAAPSP
jgi:hypothetical protein